jgi:hypothetical protein
MLKVKNLVYFSIDVHKRNLYLFRMFLVKQNNNKRLILVMLLLFNCSGCYVST